MLAFRSRAMVGSATLTTVASSAATLEPRTVASRIQRPGPVPSRICSISAGPGPSDDQFVDEAPPPVLARLEGADDRMVALVEVRGGVPPRRGVAAPHMPARQAQSQVHPAAALRQALLAPLRRPRR